MDNKDVWKSASHVLLYFKTKPCVKGFSACPSQQLECPFYHHKYDRRRSLTSYKYSGSCCQSVRRGEDWTDMDSCPLGDACPHTHNRIEHQFHPNIYKSAWCHRIQSTNSCPKGLFCAFAHSQQELNDWDERRKPFIPYLSNDIHSSHIEASLVIKDRIRVAEKNVEAAEGVLLGLKSIYLEGAADIRLLQKKWQNLSVKLAEYVAKLEKTQNVYVEDTKLLKLRSVEQVMETMYNCVPGLREKMSSFNSEVDPIQDTFRAVRKELPGCKPMSEFLPAYYEIVHEDFKPTIGDAIVRRVIELIKGNRAAEELEECLDDTCCVCFEMLASAAMTSCKKCQIHIHEHCLNEWLKKNPTCPQCRAICMYVIQ